MDVEDELLKVITRLRRERDELLTVIAGVYAKMPHHDGIACTVTLHEREVKRIVAAYTRKDWS